MDQQDLALTVITLSALVGLYLGTGVGVQDFEDLYFSGSEKPAVENDTENSSFVYGSAHEHALFYVSVNGTELDFSSRRFQLNSDYVHLENRKSHIVHKHAEEVTWKDFFETMNLTVRNDSSFCADIYNQSYCGNGTLVLNGETDLDLDTEIEQGDNLAIVIGGNVSSLAEDYMKKQLPQKYKPEESRGRRL